MVTSFAEQREGGSRTGAAVSWLAWVGQARSIRTRCGAREKRVALVTPRVTRDAPRCTSTRNDAFVCVLSVQAFLVAGEVCV